MSLTPVDRILLVSLAHFRLNGRVFQVPNEQQRVKFVLDIGGEAREFW